jgi:hypothetical protein
MPKSNKAMPTSPAISRALRLETGHRSGEQAGTAKPAK